MVNSSMFDRTNGSAPSQTLGYAQRLNGSTNEKYGLARSISVMPGDVINAEVYAKYVDPVTSNWNATLTNLVNQVAAGTAGVVVDGANYSTSTSSFPTTYPGLQSKTDNGAPKAYLNWLVFDRNFVFLNGGFKQITTAGKEAGTDVAHERVFNTNPILIAEPGYVYIYVSNENTTPVDVYFDDFKVTQAKSPVIEDQFYYPFGLLAQSFSKESSIPNMYKYNGKELQDELNLGWYDYGYRIYLPELGKWNRIDDFSDKYHPLSPYNYTYNDPINYIDPNGDSVIQVKINDQSGYIHGMSTVYIDHTIYDQFVALLNLAATTGTHIHLNSAFRTNKRQKEIASDPNSITPAKPGSSPHNSGVGVDVQLYKDNDVAKGLIHGNQGVTKSNNFIAEAVKAGWRFGGDWKDPVHLDLRPESSIFNSIRDANQQQMNGWEESSNNEKYVTRNEHVSIGLTKYQRWLLNPTDKKLALEAVKELGSEIRAQKAMLTNLKNELDGLIKK